MEPTFSDAATFGSTSTLHDPNPKHTDYANEYDPTSRFTSISSNLKNLKKANDFLQIRQETLYGKIKSIGLEQRERDSSRLSEKESLNYLMKRFSNGGLSSMLTESRASTEHTLGYGRCGKEVETSCRKDWNCDTLRKPHNALAQGSIDFEKQELLTEIRGLNAQIAFQENTIKDDQEIIKVLSDTIKIMTDYIAELERQEKNTSREDSFNIFSPAKAPPAGLGSVSTVEASPRSSRDMESRFSSVEAEIASLLRAIQKAKKNHRRIGQFSEHSVPYHNSETFLSSWSAEHCRDVPHVYRETEFTARHGNNFDNADEVIERERLTAFNVPKIYQVAESSGFYTLYPQDNSICSTKAFFKFQNLCPLSVGGVTYDINVFLERTYDRDRGDVMSLRICFPGIWDCSVDAPEPDIFVSRCLVVFNVLMDKENTPLSKYYVLHGIKAHDEPSHDHKTRLDCERGNEEIFDASFCPSHMLKLRGLPKNHSSWKANRSQRPESLKIEIKLFQLKYRLCKEESYATGILTQEEKFLCFSNTDHGNCSDVVFRIQNDADPCHQFSVSSCVCIMMNCSPLFKEILHSNNYCFAAPFEDIEVRNTPKDTLVAVLNYLHGIDNGSSWRRSVRMNLEVLAFAYEYFIPELAQLSTHNLIVTPDCYYTLDLVLKLLFMAKKLHNSELENRALSWL